jgi:endonuclease YncB( thermonuclease family)
MQVGIAHAVGGLLLIILITGGAFAVGTQWSEEESHTASAASTQEEGEELASGAEEESAEVATNRELFDVVKVIDGDTITIKIEGKNETIRLIGLDTPETSDPRTGVQCFGKEATAKLKAVIGKRVSIEKDAGEGERDKYDRLLAYVYSEEGILLNKYLIEQGYAYEYTYKTPYKYQKEFKAAEADAKAKKRGLWAPDACPEPTKAAPKAQAPAQAAAAAVVTQETKKIESESKVEEKKTEPKEESKEDLAKKEPEPESQEEEEETQSSSSYTCSSNKYNCTHFKTQAEAQAVFDQCGGADNDVHKLDNNKDGEACESLP